MIIRPATVWDAPKIADLWYAMHQEITTNKALLKENSNKENLMLAAVTRVKLPEWCVLVAHGKSEDEAWGFLMGTICYPRYNPCHILAVVEAAYIHPLIRGIGLFKQLLDEGSKWAKEKNAAEIEFMAMSGSRVTKLYERMGYEPVLTTYRKKEA